MDHYEETGNSLPYIDDTPTTEDDISNEQYNLKIIENYQNKNRNIEITNKYPDDITSKSLSPVAPLAEETEFSDGRLSDSQEDEPCKHVKGLIPTQTGTKLIIKGWHSSISIQGLDNRSSITFKRKSERVRASKVMGNVQRKESMESSKTVQEKPTKKGRWKMLTRSLISKSTRFERKGMDERYPKYVLLKNEEEEEEKESYPKMIILNDKDKRKENLPIPKSEFNLKKSFKNKTKPIVPMEKLLSKKPEEEGKPEVVKKKKPLTERRTKDNVIIKKKMVMERRKSFGGKVISPSKAEAEVVFNVTGCDATQAQVLNEIQGIFEDTLKLYPELKQSPRENCAKQSYVPQTEEYFSSVPPQYCQYPCHDPFCYTTPLNQPPLYIPVYNPYPKPKHSYTNTNTQTNESRMSEDSLKQNGHTDKEVDLQGLPFGILSSFFPRVVIMKTYHSDNMGEEERIADGSSGDLQVPKAEVNRKEAPEVKTIETLEVPLPDLTVKSKMVPEAIITEPEMVEEMPDVYTMRLALNEMISSEKDRKTRTESESTEYLHFQENESQENEAIDPPTPWKSKAKSDEEGIPKSKHQRRESEGGQGEKFKTMEDEEEEEGEKNQTPKNLSLTKIGYKMYDSLTKLSLEREKEIIKKPETSGCGCNGNGTNKSQYNITLESNNRVIKVTVPENELNFRIVNSGGRDIQIGVTSGEIEDTGNGNGNKKIVSKNELWHSDDGGSATVALEPKNREKTRPEKDSQMIKLSFADNKEVVVSIEKDEKPEREKQKITKEMKVGTDDFKVAERDSICTMGRNYRNLSPQTGQLLKDLQKRLEIGERERKFLEERINQKLEDGLFPGVFLVRQISPRDRVPKKPSEVTSLRKIQKTKPETDTGIGQLREYYCEECLATMRIFEDENPSVKRMVDKFETIIQLESY